jgi:RNA-directed DNA polymerase
MVLSSNDKVMNTALKPMYEWKDINWRKAERCVFKLQKRIFKASQRGDVKLVHKLPRLILKSWYAKLIAVRRVSQDNQGKKTAGVDGIKSLTPKQRMALAKNIRLGNKSKPTPQVVLIKRLNPIIRGVE